MSNFFDHEPEEIKLPLDSMLIRLARDVRVIRMLVKINPTAKRPAAFYMFLHDLPILPEARRYMIWWIHKMRMAKPGEIFEWSVTPAMDRRTICSVLWTKPNKAVKRSTKQ